MKRWSATLLVFAVCSAVVHADVTIVQKTTVEGGAASMAQGGIPTPTVTNRIKGMKGRTDMDMGASSPIPANISTITDATAKQVTILDHNQKNARVATGTQPPPAAAANMPSLSVDASIKPTGKSQTIDGMKCDEYAFSTSMSMANVGGAQMPPETAALMKDVTMVMKGSLWVTKDAPGAAEYLAYQKAMTSADLAAAAMGAAGMNMPGMDKMMKAMQGVEGIPILTEMDMTIEGSGQMADMMRQMGAMRITTKVLSVKTDSLNDDIFKVPEGYQVVK
jgi:hypothetical protein